MKRARDLTPFGRKVKKRMIDIEISQNELSRKVGCCSSYLGDILHGRRSGIKHLQAICRELNMPYEGDESSRGA